VKKEETLCKKVQNAVKSIERTWERDTGAMSGKWNWPSSSNHWSNLGAYQHQIEQTRIIFILAINMDSWVKFYSFVCSRFGCQRFIDSSLARSRTRQLSQWVKGIRKYVVRTAISDKSIALHSKTNSIKKFCST
jgi:hypothetical protein